MNEVCYPCIQVFIRASSLCLPELQTVRLPKRLKLALDAGLVFRDASHKLIELETSQLFIGENNCSPF